MLGFFEFTTGERMDFAAERGKKGEDPISPGLLETDM